MARKYRRELKKSDFWCFRGVEMHFFARNAQTASEIGDLKVGITQIDPGGSNGSKKSEVRSYGARRASKFQGFCRVHIRRKFLTCRRPRPRPRPRNMTQNVTILRLLPRQEGEAIRNHGLQFFFGPFNRLRSHGKFGVDFSTKWTFYLLE